MNNKITNMNPDIYRIIADQIFVHIKSIKEKRDDLTKLSKQLNDLFSVVVDNAQSQNIAICDKLDKIIADPTENNMECSLNFLGNIDDYTMFRHVWSIIYVIMTNDVYRDYNKPDTSIGKYYKKILDEYIYNENFINNIIINKSFLNLIDNKDKLKVTFAVPETVTRFIDNINDFSKTSDNYTNENIKKNNKFKMLKYCVPLVVGFGLGIIYSKAHQ